MVCRLPVFVGPDAIVSTPENTALALFTFCGSVSCLQAQACALPSVTTTVIRPRSRTTRRRRARPGMALIASQAENLREDARHAVLVVRGRDAVGGRADGGMGVGH